jgi:hypothetical protein
VAVEHLELDHPVALGGDLSHRLLTIAPGDPAAQIRDITEPSPFGRRRGGH